MKKCASEAWGVRHIVVNRNRCERVNVAVTEKNLRNGSRKSRELNKRCGMRTTNKLVL